MLSASGPSNLFSHSGAAGRGRKRGCAAVVSSKGLQGTRIITRMQSHKGIELYDALHPTRRVQQLLGEGTWAATSYNRQSTGQICGKADCKTTPPVTVRAAAQFTDALQRLTATDSHPTVGLTDCGLKGQRAPTFGS
jgi:hypothetical protein